MIKQMWPYIGEYVKGLLKTTVEQQVSNALPASLQPFRFEKIDLGDAVSINHCIIKGPQRPSKLRPFRLKEIDALLFRSI